MISNERLEQVQIKHKDYDEMGCRPEVTNGFLEYEEEGNIVNELIEARRKIELLKILSTDLCKRLDDYVGNGELEDELLFEEYDSVMKEVE